MLQPDLRGTCQAAAGDWSFHWKWALINAQNNPTNVNYLSGLLGVILNIPSGGGLLGVDCSPITVLGTGTGANCVQQTVCCDNVDFVSHSPERKGMTES